MFICRYYVVDGKAKVRSKDGTELATIAPHHFIGEMAFLVYCQNVKRDAVAANDKAESSRATPYAEASASVFADGLVRVWEWDASELADGMSKDRDMSNAFATYCSHDLRRKLLRANTIRSTAV